MIDSYESVRKLECKVNTFTSFKLSNLQIVSASIDYTAKCQMKGTDAANVSSGELDVPRS